MKRIGLVLALSTMTATAALAQTAPQPQQQPAGPPAPPAIQALSEPANRFLRDADIVAGATQSLAAANNSLAGDSREFVQKWQGLMSWAQTEKQKLDSATKASDEAKTLALSRADDLAKVRREQRDLIAQLNHLGVGVNIVNGSVSLVRASNMHLPPIEPDELPHGTQSHPQSPAPR